MTKDLTLLIGHCQGWMTTRQFLDKLDEGLKDGDGVRRRLLAHVVRPVAAVDSLIAATALTHRLRVVTRNARDVRFPGVDVVNPWEAGD